MVACKESNLVSMVAKHFTSLIDNLRGKNLILIVHVILVPQAELNSGKEN